MAPYHNNPSLDADMDTFLDFNGGGGLQSPTSPVDHINSMIAPEHADERQAFPGPSHEYGLFKQQTGLPSGAMSTITSFSDMPGDSDFMSPGTSYGNHPGFGSVDMNYNSGFNLDMEYEATPQSATPAYFFPGVPSDGNDFGESSGGGAFDAPPANPQRLYPGSHSQQAERARADATARQQRRQQQAQHVLPQRQREQSSSISSQQSTASRKGRSGSQAGADPVADERISRILDHMRHNSGISTIEEEQSALDDAAARSAKMRREEEDMDEDERLLASEEGKKLSSKERRQLRNKVSARAFRSRRKEYITQLEGENAVKVNECNELRINNRKLTEENGQLKHLTRTLLSHPAFQTFLDDMSRDPTFIAPTQPPSTQQQEPAPSNEKEQGGEVIKEEHSPTSNDTQVNMASMPQTSLDFSMLNLGNNHWGSGNSVFTFQQPQVFAIFEVPQGPSDDALVVPRIFSGKPTDTALSTSESTPAKRNIPRAIEFPAARASVDPEASSSSTMEDTQDAQFTLYANAPVQSCSRSSPPTLTIDIAARLVESSLSGKKAPTHFPLVVTEQQSDEALAEEVNAMFDSLDSSLRRIERLTWHQFKS